MAEQGTSMPPELESEVWEEYTRRIKWSVGVRYEPLTEKWYVSPAIYGPGSPFISAKNNPMGKTKFAKASRPICIFSVGSIVLAA